MKHEPLKNRDIRFCCMENGVKFWQIALQLGISPETFTRKMRSKLDPEKKRRKSTEQSHAYYRDTKTPVIF